MKRRIPTFFKFLIGLIIVLIIASFIVVQNLKPTYKGEISISNLASETTVHFDDYGIPHIYANNQEDALRSLGYIHAQDRLWQMELLRRVAPGRLSEIFGEVALENDLLFAGLGIEEASKQAIEYLDKKSPTYKLSMAYLDGINQFIENGPTPIEFHLLGINKEKFNLKDTYNIMGYMSFSFAMAHKTDPVLSMIQSKLGDNYLNELGIETSKNSTLIYNYNETHENISIAVNKILKKSPVPSFIGSNSWIVSGEKSKSGKVLFANDPHIEFASPSVWYEAHIKTPNFESYGYYFAGIAFPVMSHNRDYAYGITMFENDDINFYQEKNLHNDNSKYLHNNKYYDYKITNKTIKIKDQEDLSIEIKSSIHGPIMNDFIKSVDSKNPISMSWIYTKMPNELLTSIYEMSRAKNKEDFNIGVSRIHAPGLNMMYGDNDGNISWWAAAQLYKFGNNSNSKLIMDGSLDDNKIETFLNFTQNPQAHNPSWNYVYSANNQPDSIAGILYPGYYLPEDRAKRIVELLEPKNDWTKEDFMTMINDTKSSVAPNLIKVISNEIKEYLTTPSEKEALQLLEEWNGDYKKSSVAATIYTKFIYQFLVNTFEDEIGKETFETFINTHLMSRMLAEQLHKEYSVWWNNIHTEKKERKRDILTNSFSQAIKTLEKQLGKNIDRWTWNRVLTLEHPHPLGSVKILDYLFNFNVGLFELDGSNEVLNNQLFNLNNEGVYKVRGGPSTRRIIDFSDVENSVSILPTGNSGNVFSPFFKDQAKMYINGKFRKMKMNKDEIEQVSTKLILTPKQ